MTAAETSDRVASRSAWLAVAPGHYWLRIAFVALAIEVAAARGIPAPRAQSVSS